MLDKVKKISREEHDKFEYDEDALDELVESSGDVILPDDFWKEFRLEVGDNGEIHQNHALLEKLT